MEFSLHLIKIDELPNILVLFKEAAEKIAKKNIDHWQYWKNPPKEKIKWVKEGIDNNEFFFIKDTNKNMLGMVRILKEDTLYWGNTNDNAIYVHSLVIKEQFEGKGMGTKILNMIASNAKIDGVNFLRLDCVANNKGLCNYYEKQGFVKVGEKIMPLSVNNLYQKKL
ncbi:GNAT family N-acetyltransferase [Tenacibaculum sp. 190524A02b]|uniref:GNAT family N-acetyltransferase n=1 Tax=Tenacibaculum vairaonense TaxID=3137860 RepID=A0ABM9PP66_9FLAO